MKETPSIIAAADQELAELEARLDEIIEASVVAWKLLGIKDSDSTRRVSALINLLGTDRKNAILAVAIHRLSKLAQE